MMKVTAREDIEAPLDKVFTELCDFESIERQALRRGIEVRRTDTVAGLGEGMTWHARFRFRGKERALRGKIAQLCSTPFPAGSRRAAPSIWWRCRAAARG